MEQILFQTQSALIVILLTLGIFFKRNRKIHIRIMLSAIIWDIILVLQIELSRNAIAKASAISKNSLLLNIHVLLALSTVLLYFVVIYFGKKLIDGHFQYRKTHKLLGTLTYTLRILTFITSFFVVN